MAERSDGNILTRGKKELLPLLIRRSDPSVKPIISFQYF